MMAKRMRCRRSQSSRQRPMNSCRRSTIACRLIVPLEHAARWFDRSEHDVGDLLQPFPAEQMTAYAVSTRVNSVRNDGPELIEPSRLAALEA
jgi:hypothetical protein